MKKIKSITFVVNDLGFFFSHRKNLITLIEKHNRKINIICPKLSSFNNNKYKHKIINFFMRQRGKNIFFELLCFFDLFLKMIIVRSDIYHLISFKPILYGSLISKIFKKKIICSFSGLGIFKRINKKTLYSKILILLLIYSLKNNKNVFLIFQNTSDLNILNSFLNFKENGNHNLIQGSGVNIGTYKEIFKNRTISSKKTFVFASRLINEKGILNFIEASIEFNKKFKNNDIEFIIAGKFIKDELIWKTKNEFVSYINQLDENIKYLDHQDNMNALFKIASVIVLPTYYGEGVPKILIESLASGVPIITTFQRGCRELVDNGKNGFICRKKNSKNLSSVFEKFIKLPNHEMNQMSLNCMLYAKNNLSLEKVNENHSVAYNYFNKLI
tara:strand:+ start:638 stop:1795 length:1158 start_codon:yes stop_codon:yes gene_type:complete